MKHSLLTLEEANELNSYCAICGKLKFVVRRSPNPPHLTPHYELVRCTKLPDDCDMHCQFGHQNEQISIPDGREDVVEIASGWNA